MSDREKIAAYLAEISDLEKQITKSPSMQAEQYRKRLLDTASRNLRDLRDHLRFAQLKTVATD